MIFDKPYKQFENFIFALTTITIDNPQHQSISKNSCKRLKQLFFLQANVL